MTDLGREGKYKFRLYVTGNSGRSHRTEQNVKGLLDETFTGAYELEIIDVRKNSQIVEDDKVLATPTLCKIHPLPPIRIIGNIRDREKLLTALDLAK